MSDTVEDKELREAADRLSAVKQRLAAAEEMKLQAARLAISERQLNLEREQQRQRDYNAEVEAKFAAKAKAKVDAEMAEANAERAKQSALESEFNRIQEATRVRLAHEAKVRKIQEESFLVEAEAKRAEAEAFAERTKAEVPAFEPDKDADGTLDNTGIENSASAMEVKPEEWGNPQLRNLLRRRSTETANAAPPPEFIPNFEQAPQPLTNEEILVMLRQKWGAQVVDDAVAFLKTLKGTQNLQVYLAANHKPISN